MTVKLVPYLTRDQALHLLDLPESERHDWVKERVRFGEIELIPEPDDCDERFTAAKLTRTNSVGISQSRNYEFDHRIWEAQAIQCLFIAAGTQARDMAVDGVRVTEGINGARTTFAGYRGPVCFEAMEKISPYLELMPRFKRF